MKVHRLIYYTLKHTLLTIIMLYASLSAHAQSNHYGMNDALYPIYERALQQGDSSSVLLVADTLMSKARDMKDVKGQAFAAMLKVDYYENVDSAKFEKACDDLMKLVKGTRYRDYYFYAFSRRVEYQAYSYHFSRAAQMVKQMRLEAEADTSHYGISMALQGISNMYYYQGNYKLSEQYQLEYVKYIKQHLPTTLADTPYVNMIGTAVAGRRFDDALRYADIASTMKPTPDMPNSIMAMRCVVYFLTNNDAEFDKAYARLESDIAKNHIVHETEKMARICKRARDGRYDNAMAMVDGDDDLTDMLRVNIALRKGDALKAVSLLQHQVARKDSLFAEMMQTDLNDISASLDNMTLSMENTRLEVNNAIYRNGVYLALLVLLVVTLAFILHGNRRRHRNMQMLEQAYKETETARRRAEEMNRVKTEFIKNMTHEIRTPLNTINGFSQLLVLDDPAISDNDRRLFANSIQQGTLDITAMADGIISVSELDTDYLPLNISEVEVAPLAQAAVDAMAPRCAEGVDMTCTLTDTAPATITTDVERLHELLTQLLSNAAKYTDSGHIRLSVSKLADRAIFCVEDTGTGIPADQAEKVFERFEKLGSYKPGVGLGLSIARLLATHLGGRLYVDTHYTSGARLVLEMPLHAERPEQEQDK